MTNGLRYFFGLYFLAVGFLVLFVLPNTTAVKFINYCIIGMYIAAIFWWWLQEYPWWVAYWFSALCITAVVTFGNLTTR